MKKARKKYFTQNYGKVLLNIKKVANYQNIVRSNFGKSKKSLRMKMKEKFEPEIVNYRTACKFRSRS